jgi:hypothetical protein
MKDIIECDRSPLPISGDLIDPRHRKFQSWSHGEDIRLLSGIYQYGVRSWSTISRFVGNGRTRTQCAQRWSRSLNPRIQKETWSHEEESALVGYVAKFGEKSWSRIAALLGTRSDVQCRYHYNQIVKNGNWPGASPFAPGPPSPAVRSMPDIHQPTLTDWRSPSLPSAEFERMRLGMRIPPAPQTPPPPPPRPTLEQEEPSKPVLVLSPIENILKRLNR